MLLPWWSNDFEGSGSLVQMLKTGISLRVNCQTLSIGFHSKKGVGKIRPKLPTLPAGSWPLPPLPLRAPPLPEGDTPGHPVPPPKSTPRSLLFKPPDEPRPSSAAHSWSVKDWFELRTYKPVALPSEAPAVVCTTSQAKYSQRMEECAVRFHNCLHRAADASALHMELQT